MMQQFHDHVAIPGEISIGNASNTKYLQQLVWAVASLVRLRQALAWGSKTSIQEIGPADPITAETSLGLHFSADLRRVVHQ